MPKYSIEIDDTLPDIIDDTCDSLRELLVDWLNDNPEQEETPCLSNDIDYDGRFHELVDGAVPLYTKEINDAFYLHGDEIEQAFHDAGIGEASDDGWPAGWKAAAIYCYIEQACWEWWNDNAADVFDEWKAEQGKEGEK